MRHIEKWSSDFSICLILHKKSILCRQLRGGSSSMKGCIFQPPNMHPQSVGFQMLIRTCSTCSTLFLAFFIMRACARGSFSRFFYTFLGSPRHSWDFPGIPGYSHAFLGAPRFLWNSGRGCYGAHRRVFFCQKYIILQKKYRAVPIILLNFAAE